MELLTSRHAGQQRCLLHTCIGESHLRPTEVFDTHLYWRRSSEANRGV